MNAHQGQSAANRSGTALRRSALVCFAVNQEAAPFRRLAADRDHVRVVVTGIGRRNAERCIKYELSRGTPEFVLTAGFAGAECAACCACDGTAGDSISPVTVANTIKIFLMSTRLLPPRCRGHSDQTFRSL